MKQVIVQRGKIIGVLFVVLSVICGCNKQDVLIGEISNETLSVELSESELVVESTMEVNGKMEIDVNIYEELSLMQKVLLNKTSFKGVLSSDEEEIMDVHKIEEVSSIYENTDDAYFYVIDLDHDKMNEVCVVYSPGRVLIFDEEQDEIFAYRTVYRSFAPVYMDGTFGGDGGASLSYLYGNVSFEGNTFYRETIVSTWSDIEGVTHYYKGNPANFEGENGREITKDEYDQIMSQYPQVEATAYDFTIENILKYVE